MDLITKDLEAGISEIEHGETVASKYYVELLAASEASRAPSMKSIMDKESAKVAIGAEKVAAKETEMGALKELEI